MPHISKRKLSQKTIYGLERHLVTIITDTGSKTRTHIFEELLTQTEKIMLAKRLATLFLLKKGVSTHDISKQLGISSSTADRFRLAVDSGRYRYTCNWLRKHTKEGKCDALIEALVSLAFTGRTKSFKRFVEEL